jgi:hypothetical protein
MSSIRRQFFIYWGSSGTEFTITETIKLPIVPAPDDDEREGTGGVLGRGN